MSTLGSIFCDISTKGHIFFVFGTIWLVIKLDRDFMPIKILPKVNEDWIRNSSVSRQALFALNNKRAITLLFLGQSGWLLILAEI